MNYFVNEKGYYGDFGGAYITKHFQRIDELVLLDWPVRT